MELTYLNSTITTTTCHFNQPIFNNTRTMRLSQTHHPSFVKLKATTTSSVPSIRQPKYKIPTKPHQKKNQTCNKNSIFDVLRLMDGLGINVSADIYVSLIDECTRKRDAVQAAELYTHMKKNARIVGYLKRFSGLSLLNRLLLMLVNCGYFDVAHHLFDEMPHRNSISLAIVISGLVDNQLFDEALRLFVKMHRWFVYDMGLQVVVVSFLKGCAHLNEVGLGKMVHGWLLKMGCDIGLFVDTALVEFYGKTGCLWEANCVFFDHNRVVGRRDTVLWTGVIVNNCREQCFEEVIRIFQEMGEAGVKMNEYTFSTVIKACGRVSDDGSFGQQVHANAIKLAFDTRVFVLCALIDMYGRCGLLKDAKKVFDMMDHSKRNSACWNAMVTGFIHHGLYIEALKMIYQMKAVGLQPQKSMIDEVRLTCGSLKLEI